MFGPFTDLDGATGRAVMVAREQDVYSAIRNGGQRWPPSTDQFEAESSLWLTEGVVSGEDPETAFWQRAEDSPDFLHLLPRYPTVLSGQPASGIQDEGRNFTIAIEGRYRPDWSDVTFVVLKGGEYPSDEVIERHIVVAGDN